jgi:hypothetical protein
MLNWLNKKTLFKMMAKIKVIMKEEDSQIQHIQIWLKLKCNNKDKNLRCYLKNKNMNIWAITWNKLYKKNKLLFLCNQRI